MVGVTPWRSWRILYSRNNLYFKILLCLHPVLLYLIAIFLKGDLENPMQRPPLNPSQSFIFVQSSKWLWYYNEKCAHEIY